MSTDTNAASTNLAQEAKVKDLKSFLDKLVQENKLKSEYVDVIIQESIAHNFGNDILSSTDEKISYTGWLTVFSVGGGGYWFSSWSGDFKMNGALGPAAGLGWFPYARMDIFTQYNYNQCKGSMTFRLVPVGMDLWFSMDEKGNIPVGNGFAAGLAPTGGVGIGDFTITKSS
jgi:hypothetical protein